MQKLMKQFKGLISIAELLGMVVIAVILGALIGTVADKTIGINTSASNVTGATYTMVALVPLFLVITILLAMVKHATGE